MTFVRGIFFLLLGAAAVCFALYAATGEQRFRSIGMRTFIGTVVAGLIFFALLIAQRVLGLG